jgi:hypothetical protein
MASLPAGGERTAAPLGSEAHWIQANPGSRDAEEHCSSGALFFRGFGGRLRAPERGVVRGFQVLRYWEVVESEGIPIRYIWRCFRGRQWKVVESGEAPDSLFI